MNFVLPENLDLEKLLHENKPDFKYQSVDQFKFIIHVLLTRSQYNKDLISEDYIFLKAYFLQSYVRDYNKIIAHLIHIGVLESDNQYIPGSKSTGFRLTDQYQVPIKFEPIVYPILRKIFKKKFNQLQFSVNEYDYINKWFNDKLKIDESLVKEYLKKEYDLKRADINLRDYDPNTKKYKIPINQYNNAIISLSNFTSKFWNIRRDNNVYRYHSVLTNMRSMSRNALTYDGQKLVSIDIKNSQPYISTLLLSNTFWVIESTPQSVSFFRKNEDSIHSIPFKKIDIQGEYESIERIKYERIKTRVSIPFTMIVKSLKGIDFQNIDQYIYLVVSGQFYEYLEKEFKKNLGLGYANRKAVKSAVFQILFTANQYIGQKKAAPKKLFSKLFPEVYKIFNVIKKEDKTILPRLLQSIESYLMIDIIAKRISKELPHAPIYTIHDSITTTEQYADRVEQIMHEELNKAIGYPPTLARDEYDPQKIYDHIHKLQKQAAINWVHYLGPDFPHHLLEGTA